MNMKERRGTMDKIAVQCLECGRKFRTSSMLPECPKCGGSDVDVADIRDIRAFLPFGRV